MGSPNSPSSTSKASADTGPVSPIQELINRLDEYERAVDRMRINANFKVNAFSYSGELLSDEERAKRGRSKKRKRGKH